MDAHRRPAAADANALLRAIVAVLPNAIDA
jgi:hypothetical protein